MAEVIDCSNCALFGSNGEDVKSFEAGHAGGNLGGPEDQPIDLRIFLGEVFGEFVDVNFRTGIDRAERKG